MHLKRSLSITFILMIVFILSIGTGYTQEDNLLTNPDFEDGFHEVADFPAEVADGWQPWNAESSAFKPFYISIAEAEATGLIARVNTGEEAQVYYSSFSTHDAGIYQQVTKITPGTELVFSIYAYIFSNDDPANLESSDQPGEVEVQVGIDPTGGTDPASSNVVYTDPITVYDTYRQFSVSATATSDTVTVFVHTTVKETVINTIVYLDTASLTVVEPVVAEQATEEMTQEPVVTEQVTEEMTQEPVVTEEPTEEMTQEPVVTEEPTEEMTQEPVVTAEPTEEMTQEPVVTEEPTEEMTQEPVVTAEPTEEMTQEPVVTEEPTEEMTQEPVVTAEPTEEVMPTQDVAAILAEYPEQVTHTVQRGDNVNDIAIQYGSSIAAILAANELDESALIFIGQELVIPVKELPQMDNTGTGDETQDMGDGSEQQADNTSNTETYVVTYGDTLYSIANRFNTTINELAQLNGLSNSNRISVGQILLIPAEDTSSNQAEDNKPYYGGDDNKPADNYQAPAQDYQDNKGYHGGDNAYQGASLYVVQPGDTLYRISIKFDVSLVALAEINNISNYQLVFVGQVLVIPDKR